MSPPNRVQSPIREHSSPISSIWESISAIEQTGQDAGRKLNTEIFTISSEPSIHEQDVSDKIRPKANYAK